MIILHNTTVYYMIMIYKLLMDTPQAILVLLLTGFTTLFSFYSLLSIYASFSSCYFILSFDDLLLL
jgi:hypothetical protein